MPSWGIWGQAVNSSTTRVLLFPCAKDRRILFD